MKASSNRQESKTSHPQSASPIRGLWNLNRRTNSSDTFGGNGSADTEFTVGKAKSRTGRRQPFFKKVMERLSNKTERIVVLTPIEYQNLPTFSTNADENTPPARNIAVPRQNLLAVLISTDPPKLGAAIQRVQRHPDEACCSGQHGKFPMHEAMALLSRTHHLEDTSAINTLLTTLLIAYPAAAYQPDASGTIPIFELLRYGTVKMATISLFILTNPQVVDDAFKEPKTGHTLKEVQQLQQPNNIILKNLLYQSKDLWLKARGEVRRKLQEHHSGTQVPHATVGYSGTDNPFFLSCGDDETIYSALTAAYEAAIQSHQPADNGVGSICSFYTSGDEACRESETMGLWDTDAPTKVEDTSITANITHRLDSTVRTTADCTNTDLDGTWSFNSSDKCSSARMGTAALVGNGDIDVHPHKSFGQIHGSVSASAEIVQGSVSDIPSSIEVFCNQSVERVHTSSSVGTCDICNDDVTIEYEWPEGDEAEIRYDDHTESYTDDDNLTAIIRAVAAGVANGRESDLTGVDVASCGDDTRTLNSFSTVKSEDNLEVLFKQAATMEFSNRVSEKHTAQSRAISQSARSLQHFECWSVAGIPVYD